MGIALVVSGVLPSWAFIAFVFASFAMGLSVPMYSEAYMALLQSKIEPSVLGRVMGVVNSMMLIATPIGFLVTGPGAEVMGVAGWFPFLGVLIVFLGLASMINKSIKSIET